MVDRFNEKEARRPCMGRRKMANVRISANYIHKYTDTDRNVHDWPTWFVFRRRQWSMTRLLAFKKKKIIIIRRSRQTYNSCLPHVRKESTDMDAPNFIQSVNYTFHSYYIATISSAPRCVCVCVNPDNTI